MLKFNRIYELQVEVSTGNLYTSPLRNRANFERPFNAHVTITLPYACEFQICRQSLSSAQTGTFLIKNLSPEIRRAIQKDAYRAGEMRAIRFRAGYANATGFQLPLVFNGTVNYAASRREGVDWITEIQAFDGGFSMVNALLPGFTAGPGLSATDAIRELAMTLPGTAGLPIIGDFPETNKRAEIYMGSTWDLIQKKSRGTATIDNGQLKALNFWEVIDGHVPEINDGSGIVGSPAVAYTTVDFDMLFEPCLTVGQLIRLNVSSTPELNREWKVLGFEHRGTITDVGLAGECLTHVRLWFTDKELARVSGQPVIF